MKLFLKSVAPDRRAPLRDIVKRSHPWLAITVADLAAECWVLERHGTLLESVREEYILAEGLESNGFRLHITENNQWEVR